MSNQLDKYAQESFSLPIRHMIADLCEQDTAVYAVLMYLAKNASEQTTVAYLAENVETQRKVGVRNAKGAITTYRYEHTNLGRTRAERVIEKLAFAGLVDISPKLPLKLLSISIRGRQIVTELASRQERNALQTQGGNTDNDK